MDEKLDELMNGWTVDWQTLGQLDEWPEWLCEQTDEWMDT